MAYPWDADRTLTQGQARALIESQFPALAPVEIELIGSGWANDAYIVNREWVFRFPRRKDTVADLEREVAVMPFVAAALSGLPLGVPLFEKVGRPAEQFPYPFAGYRFLPGVDGDALPGSLDQVALAQGLGEALSRLHGIPRERMKGLDIRTDNDGPVEWLEHLIREEAKLPRDLPPDLDDICRPWLRGDIDVPSPSAGPHRVIHNDLCPEHVLIDPASGTLAAILDFGDLSFGDPALDFVPLCTWLGRDFADRVLTHYELPIDDGFWNRLQFLARVISLAWLGEAQLRAPSQVPTKHLGWIRHAFDRA